MNDEEFAQIYRDMELELVSSMKKNLLRHLKEEKKVGFKFTQWQSETLKEMKRFQKENKSIIGDYTKGLDKEVQKILKDELKQGSKDEFKKYKKILGNNFKESDNLRGNFFKLNDRKLKELIKTVNNDLRSANSACFRMINDQYKKTIVRAVMFSNHGVVSPKKAIDMATKDFLSAGINCVEYKNGRRVNVASYSQMAIRTANKRAQLIGEGQFRQEIGEHLVQITSHGGTCKLCSKWEGKVLIDDVYSGGSKKDGKYPLLSTAMEQGLFHPNCRHGLPTYYKELDEIKEEINSDDVTKKQYQEELNYINQNIYKYQRLEVGSLDEENIQKYKEKKQEWKNKKRDVIKELNNSNYEDITQEYIDNATPNSHKILDRNYFKYEDVKYEVDGKNVVLDYSKKEKEVAEWLESTFGGEIYMIPRVNKPDNISTPDYIWNGENWDLKSITGSGKRVIEDAIKKKKKQSNNFVFDLTESKLTEEELLRQTKKIYNSKSTEFVDKVIIKKSKDVICIYKRK